MTTKTDFVVHGGGTIYMLVPRTPAAHDWIKGNLPDDALRLGRGVAVEHRYIADIVEGIHDAGLTVA